MKCLLGSLNHQNKEHEMLLSGDISKIVLILCLLWGSYIIWLCGSQINFRYLRCKRIITNTMFWSCLFQLLFPNIGFLVQFLCFYVLHTPTILLSLFETLSCPCLWANHLSNPSLIWFKTHWIAFYWWSSQIIYSNLLDPNILAMIIFLDGTFMQQETSFWHEYYTYIEEKQGNTFYTRRKHFSYTAQAALENHVILGLVVWKIKKNLKT